MRPIYTSLIPRPLLTIAVLVSVLGDLSVLFSCTLTKTVGATDSTWSRYTVGLLTSGCSGLIGELWSYAPVCRRPLVQV